MRDEELLSHRDPHSEDNQTIGQKMWFLVSYDVSEWPTMSVVKTAFTESRADAPTQT